MAHAKQTLPDAEPDVWAQALAGVQEAADQFEPFRVAYNQAEGAWFAARSDGSADTEAQRKSAKARLDEATEQERLFGNALFDAASAVYRLPAPDLEGVITKIEMTQTIGYDGSVEQLVLQDLRRLARSG